MPFRQEPPTPDRACHGRPPADTQHPGSPSGARAPVLTSPLQPSKPHNGPRRSSPELPAQFLEEKADGEEAQGGRRGKDAGPVVVQVPPQAAGEGLRGQGAGGRAAARMPLLQENLKDPTGARGRALAPIPEAWGSIIAERSSLGHAQGPPPSWKQGPFPKSQGPDQLHQETWNCGSRGQF